MILMRLIPIILIIVAVYFIVVRTIRAWETVDIEDKHDDLNTIDKRHDKVVEYKGQHVKTNKKREAIDKYLNK